VIDLKKNANNETEVHYLFIETKFLATRHKQHYEIHSEFRPWDGRQMVNIKFLIRFGLKFGLKCNKTNSNKIYSFRFT